jgi:hypothetical protein
VASGKTGSPAALGNGDSTATRDRHKQQFVRGRPVFKEREQNMEVKIRKGNLIIILPLEKPRPSASGKTMLVASSRGVRRTAIRLDGELLSVVANAFFYSNGRPRAKATRRRPSR